MNQPEGALYLHSHRNGTDDSMASSFVTARSFWPRVERRRFTELLALSNVHLAAIVGVLTAARLNILTDASYRSCMQEGEVDTFFILHCPAFARLRLRHFGSLTFGKPEDIAETDVSYLNKLVIESIVDL